MTGRTTLKQEFLQSFKDQLNRLSSAAPTLPGGPAGRVAVSSSKSKDAAFAEAVVNVYSHFCRRLDATSGWRVWDLARLYETVAGWAPAIQNDKEQVAGGKDRTGAKAAVRARRKASGSFYTPDDVIHYIVSSALAPLLRGEYRPAESLKSGQPLNSDEIIGLRILDPAMGSGLFLLAVTEYLAQAYSRALIREDKAGETLPDAKDAARYRRLIAHRCVYGVDIDEVTVKVAKLLLKALAGERRDDSKSFEEHLRYGDTLKGIPPGWDTEAYLAAVGAKAGYHPDVGGPDLNALFHWGSAFPDVFIGPDGSVKRDAGFDVVLGNPPYLSFSGRQKAAGYQPILGIHRALGVTKGWLSAHGLFMMSSVELARDGGLISMIVPDQVGHLVGYGPLRAWLLERCELVGVKYWGEDVFEDAVTPSMTFVLRKTSGHKVVPTPVVGHDGTRAEFTARGDDEWHASPSNAVVRRMQALHPALDGFSDPGVHTGNVAKKLVLKRSVPGAVPVLEGRQIHPFHCDPPVKWLKVDYRAGSGEYFRISPGSVYRDVDVILRQTADRPVAARHIHRCHFRNSVLALKIPDGFSVEYVLGVLNSEAARLIYRALAFESRQRAFPQVKVGRLKMLPLPDPVLQARSAQVQEIEHIVRLLESRHIADIGGDRLIKDLNRLVWELYGLMGHPDALADRSPD